MTIAVEAPRKQDGEDIREKDLFFIMSYQGHKCAQAFRKKSLIHAPLVKRGSYEEPAQTAGGFVRSWKLNLRLTTRAEDSHAAPDSYVAHFDVLLRMDRTRSIATKMAIRIANVIRRLSYFSSSFKGGKVYRGSSVYTACSTACKDDRQFL